MKYIKTFILSLFFILNFNPIFAENDTYIVFDDATDFKEQFDNYEDANSYYSNHKDDYDNLCFSINDDVIEMEYGIIELPINSVIKYHSIIKDKDDYLCGNYGIDAAYLYSDDNRIYFEVSGDKGYVDFNDIKLHPIDSLNASISSYFVKDDYLYHNIKTQLKYESIATSLCLDNKPEYLDNNSIYYSYDGHYFYNDFKSMINDYRNDEFANAVNNEPYYNYYQYLPYRSISNYTYKELEDYFYTKLGINGRLFHYIDNNNDFATDEVNRSQLYGNIQEFFSNQDIYGTNALMLISSSIVESNYGKSLNSYINNNLFENAVYENTFDSENNRYSSINDSIYAHSKYFVSKKYSNHYLDNYSGTFMGNKVSGINSEYYLDHYYGEKNAAQYFNLDNNIDGKDYETNAIAIVKDSEVLNIYSNEDLSKTLAKLNNITELSFVVLEKNDNCYKVNFDYSFSNEYLYDFDSSIAYIEIDDVDYLLNEDRIHNYDLKVVNYDFNGGTYHGYETLSVKTINNEETIIPKKEGYEFINYTSNLDENGYLIYKANYKKINGIYLDKTFTSSALYPYIDLDKSRIKVVYEDGTSKYIQLNSDMVSINKEDDADYITISISYCGLNIDKKVYITNSYNDTYDAITGAIENKDYSFVKNNMKTVNYQFSNEQIRNIDKELKEENKRNYVINNETSKYDISFSGLDLSIDDRHNFNLIEDTYYVQIGNANPIYAKRIIDIADGYGFKQVCSFNLSFKFNYQSVDLRGPMIVKINKDNINDTGIYSVYHYRNGDVIKCKTSQTNDYIEFIAEEKGNYVVLFMPSFNNYVIENNTENLTYENMGMDTNKINLEFMLGLSLILISLVGIIIYYRFADLKEKMWKDYRKSLLKEDTVLEEKQKS